MHKTNREKVWLPCTIKIGEALIDAEYKQVLSKGVKHVSIKCVLPRQLTIDPTMHFEFHHPYSNMINGTFNITVARTRVGSINPIAETFDGSITKKTWRDVLVLPVETSDEYVLHQSSHENLPYTVSINIGYTAHFTANLTLI